MDMMVIAQLRREIDDLKHTVIRMWALLNGQPVNQTELRELIERLGAMTHDKVKL
jgi:hypothetical protein